MEGEYYVKPPPWSVAALLERAYLRFAKLHHKALQEHTLDRDLFDRGRNMMLWLGHHVTVEFFRQITASRDIIHNAESIAMNDYRLSVEALEGMMSDVERETDYRNRMRAARSRL